MNFLNLDDKELDQHIYRIMPQEYVFTLFSDSQNVLSKISNWKDKFENFQLNLGGTLDGERFDYGFKDDFVGQCWTRHSLSEAMWGIYANDPSKRYLRIRSTPRKLLTSLAAAHPRMPQDTCFVGAVSYETEPVLKEYLANNGRPKSRHEDSSDRFFSSVGPSSTRPKYACTTSAMRATAIPAVFIGIRSTLTI